MSAEQFWLCFGLLGQAMFASRFVVQWLASEKVKRSVIPTAFWYFSVAGSMTLLCYAVHIGDPVFIIGQSTGLFIYSRNLYFIYRQSRHQAQPQAVAH